MKPIIEYRITNRLAAALVAGCVLALTAVPSAPAGEVDKRMEREIRIAEEFISDMLVESPNWLVSWGGPTSGTYLDGVGVLFQFEASLVSGSRDRKGPFGWSIFRDFGKRVVILGDDDERWDEAFDEQDWDEENWSEGDRAEEDAEDLKRYYEKRKARRERQAADAYQDGKEEIYSALVDAADVMTSLADDEWVTIIAVLDDHSFFRKNRLERLIVKARAGDLRKSIESMGNRGDRDALRSRIVEVEY